MAQIVKDSNGKVLALICDNHPTNRSFYRSIRDADAPSFKGKLCDEQIFLLHDSVHLFKSIRNNWITEKNQHISFTFDGLKFNGWWKDIIALYEKEKSAILRRTKMSHQSVYPNAIERQKVSLFYEIFNEKTVAALVEDDADDTGSFLKIFVKCWNIMNCKSPMTGLHLNDPDRIPFSCVNDHRLTFLTNFAQAIQKMPGGESFSRTSSLTSETKESLCSTILGLVALAKYLLANGHSYVLMGHFQTDRLEAEFGVYR